MYYTFSVEKDGRWWWTSCFASLWQLVVAYLARGMWYKYIYIFFPSSTYLIDQNRPWGAIFSWLALYVCASTIGEVTGFSGRSRVFIFSLSRCIYLFSWNICKSVWLLLNQQGVALTQKREKKTFLIGRRPLLSPLAYKTLFVVKSHRLQDS